MDPIPPIAPGAPTIARTGRTPVERLERVSRERDRPPKDTWERRRRDSFPEAPIEQPDPEEGQPRHIDVRV